MVCSSRSPMQGNRTMVFLKPVREPRTPLVLASVWGTSTTHCISVGLEMPSSGVTDNNSSSCRPSTSDIEQYMTHRSCASPYTSVGGTQPGWKQSKPTEDICIYTNTTGEWVCVCGGEHLHLPKMLREFENSSRYIHFKRSAFLLIAEFYVTVFFIHAELMQCVYIWDQKICIRRTEIYSNTTISRMQHPHDELQFIWMILSLYIIILARGNARALY